MTSFELLQGPDGRLFLDISTDKTTFMLEVDEGELTELRDRLQRPPIPFNVNGDSDEESDE